MYGYKKNARVKAMQKKLIACYEKAEDIVAGIGLIFGVGIIFIGVIARYIFNHPLTFVDEIAPIFIVWSTLVGYSIALRKDEHVKMDILYTAIKSPGLRRLMDLFSYLCGLLFCVFMMVYGYRAMIMQRTMNRVTQILEFPIWITYLIIPFIGAVMVIRYIGLIAGLFRKSEATENAEAEEG